MKLRRATLLDRNSTIFVAAAAALWAGDAYFRPSLARQLSASQIVLVEDLLICLCFLPVAARVTRELRGLDRRRWIALAVIGAGPQALATVLFTKALSYAFPLHAAPEPSVEYEVYLLYMLQPFFGVIGARLVLRERRRAHFWPLALLASGGVYLIVFAPNPAAPLSSLQHGQAVAALLILGAVALWASGTVLGRYLLYDVTFVTVTAMRFMLALPVLLALMLTDTGIAGFRQYALAQVPTFVGIALIPGLLAMIIYYRALSHTPASLATFAELGYPCALFLVFSLPPPVGLGAPLRLAAILGAVALVSSVSALNLLRDRRIVEAPRLPRPLLRQRSALN